MCVFVSTVFVNPCNISIIFIVIKKIRFQNMIHETGFEILNEENATCLKIIQPYIHTLKCNDDNGIYKILN